MFSLLIPFEEFDLRACELLKHANETIILLQTRRTMILLLFYLSFLCGVGWNSNYRQSFYFPFWRQDRYFCKASPATRNSRRFQSKGGAFLISAREEWGLILLLPSWTHTSETASSCSIFVVPSYWTQWPCCGSTNWIPSLWLNCRFHFQYLG